METMKGSPGRASGGGVKRSSPAPPEGARTTSRLPPETSYSSWLGSPVRRSIRTLTGSPGLGRCGSGGLGPLRLGGDAHVERPRRSERDGRVGRGEAGRLVVARAFGAAADAAADDA